MTAPPHDLERLWKVPIDPCNVQLGMAGMAIPLALQPLHWALTALVVAALVAAGYWWGQVHEKRAVPWAPQSMDDTRTGVEYDNARDVGLGVLIVVLLVWIRSAL